MLQKSQQFKCLNSVLNYSVVLKSNLIIIKETLCGNIQRYIAHVILLTGADLAGPRGAVIYLAIINVTATINNMKILFNDV